MYIEKTIVTFYKLNGQFTIKPHNNEIFNYLPFWNELM